MLDEFLLFSLNDATLASKRREKVVGEATTRKALNHSHKRNISFHCQEDFTFKGGVGGVGWYLFRCGLLICFSSTFLILIITSHTLQVAGAWSNVVHSSTNSWLLSRVGDVSTLLHWP